MAIMSSCPSNSDLVGLKNPVPSTFVAVVGRGVFEWYAVEGVWAKGPVVAY